MKRSWILRRYHRSVDVDGSLRIGYKYVSSSQKPGLFSVDTKAATDMSPVPLPTGLDFYLGAVKSPIDEDGFISLAPALSNGFLSVVAWNAKNASVLASFVNVTAPRVTDGGTLGFTLDAARSDGTYIALVDANSAVSVPFPTAWDQLALAVVDAKSGKSSVTALNPAQLSGGTAVSGLGLPKL